MALKGTTMICNTCGKEYIGTHAFCQVTEPSRLAHLLELPLEEALAEKWRLGQEKYGPDFHGHPIAQLFEELLDCINYCRVAQAGGIHLTDDMEHQFKLNAAMVQTWWQAYGPKNKT